MSAPVLRYFDCRSRGQAIRFALADAGQDFEDVRGPLPEVDAFRAQAHRPEVGGPFASLPVLEWDDVEVAQTLAIAGYLERRLGRAKAVDEELARLDMVTNAAHLDMQVPYSALLWMDGACPAERLAARAVALFDALGQRARQLEALLAERVAPFFGGAAPAVADAFVYESLIRGGAVFGAPFAERMDEVPRLRALQSALEGRPGIVAATAQLPFQVTASPSEPAIRERLRSEVSLAGSGAH